MYNGTPYYFLKNLQGDIIAIVNENRETVARYRYDAWGVCTVISDTSNCNIATINPFRYRGYYYDEEIAMYYLQSRYYDPMVGRFINADDTDYINYDNTICSVNIFATVTAIVSAYVPAIGLSVAKLLGAVRLNTTAAIALLAPILPGIITALV